MTLSAAEVTGVDVAAGGSGECDLDCSDPDGDEFLGDIDVVPGEADDVLDRLAEHMLDEDDDEYRCGAVPCSARIEVLLFELSSSIA